MKEKEEYKSDYEYGFCPIASAEQNPYCLDEQCHWWVKIKENCVLKEIESTLYEGFGEINGNLQVIGNELIRIADNTRKGDK